MLAQGADLRTIMDVLGHSTIALTSNTYAHLTDVTRRVASGMMNDILTTGSQSSMKGHPM
ncbi:MAG: hypothetical protein M3Z24_00215 [Chloroflexota bacterium]|nr:hypothetical protein [Chloroflexota bacterium]